ncbi:MAG: hypothetical protein C4555_00520 [Dehalococcoidia bacterium]|nr:MAG: hypothetical protein C4555_00520 [Dehalococcoidia bacterium]
MATYQYTCVIADGTTPTNNCNNGSVSWQLAPNDSLGIGVTEFHSIAMEGLLALTVAAGLAILIRIAREW